ncbi:glutathione S-transferase N-terminal domain-containing protein [Azomonas macrocytogenes]|uniref:Glutathione S-transferase n=1 Tax=Azomonas macrocytogenes TaxID=69962 RepID=A0A839T660_AZOMA|nr:glutathione S-transferase N-terminal domain-containing protein [Azomonas macrocytogenes]MBB3104588.1 glutathione S-transferase [Azomonas macrocytogenes]
MPRQLYELCGVDERLVFSPYCWRVKMALKHKGLDFETVPWHFQDKDALAFSGQEPSEARKVPVFVDEDGTVVTDSMAIIRYLDRIYPARPLLGDEFAAARLEFIRHWSEAVLSPAVLKIILGDLFATLDPADQPYFRRTREAHLGISLEAFQDAEAGHAALDRALVPLRRCLAHSPYLDGEAPAAADYVAFGVFMWARVVARQPLLAKDDLVDQWTERLLACFGGFAAKSPRAIDILR